MSCRFTVVCAEADPDGSRVVQCIMGFVGVWPDLTTCRMTDVHGGGPQAHRNDVPQLAQLSEDHEHVQAPLSITNDEEGFAVAVATDVSGVAQPGIGDAPAVVLACFASIDES